MLSAYPNQNQEVKSKGVRSSTLARSSQMLINVHQDHARFWPLEILHRILVASEDALSFHEALDIAVLTVIVDI